VKTRKRDFGQVFTPKLLVKQIVYTYMPEVLSNPRLTVLEPALGDGRFLTYILHQRLTQSQDIYHALQAVSTLYGIDVQKDNVIKAQEELLKTMLLMAPKMFENQNVKEIIQHIIEHNIIHGCAITKRYAETDKPIMIRHYEILSVNPINIEIEVYRLDEVLKTYQNNSLFNEPLPLSKYTDCSTEKD